MTKNLYSSEKLKQYIIRRRITAGSGRRSAADTRVGRRSAVPGIYNDVPNGLDAIAGP
jgi:hypothetical protein